MLTNRKRDGNIDKQSGEVETLEGSEKKEWTLKTKQQKKTTKQLKNCKAKNHLIERLRKKQTGKKLWSCSREQPEQNWEKIKTKSLILAQDERWRRA